MTSHEYAFAILYGVGLFLLLVVYSTLNRRVLALEVEPPKPEPKKPEPVRIAVKTRTGTTHDYGTRIQYPSNGQLIISVDDKLSSVFAAGHWLSAICVGEPPVSEKTEEAAAPTP